MGSGGDPKPSRGTLGEKTFNLELVQGVEGQCLYLDDTRFAGPKPWGGGTIIKRWTVRERDLQNAISCSFCPDMSRFPRLKE